MKKQTLLATVAAFAICGASTVAGAETVHTKVYVDTQNMENVREVQFSTFDVNHDGMYAREEVGEQLFYIFDRDNNEVIDNIEWDEESFMTIRPMEKETYQFVDYNDDGYTDLSTYTYETFYEETGLIHFDDNKNGLTPAEFIDEGFQSLDDNDNGTIELDEWKEAYEEQYIPEAAEQERYN